MYVYMYIFEKIIHYKHLESTNMYKNIIEVTYDSAVFTTLNNSYLHFGK